MSLGLSTARYLGSTPSRLTIASNSFLPQPVRWHDSCDSLYDSLVTAYLAPLRDVEVEDAHGAHLVRLPAAVQEEQLLPAHLEHPDDSLYDNLVTAYLL